MTELREVTLPPLLKVWPPNGWNLRFPDWNVERQKKKQVMTVSLPFWRAKMVGNKLSNQIDVRSSIWLVTCSVLLCHHLLLRAALSEFSHSQSYFSKSESQLSCRVEEENVTYKRSLVRTYILLGKNESKQKSYEQNTEKKIETKDWPSYSILLAFITAHQVYTDRCLPRCIEYVTNNLAIKVFGHKQELRPT